MNTVRHFAVRAATFLSLAMVILLSLVIAGYVRKRVPIGGTNDWFILLLPLLPPLVTVVGWTAARWVSSRAAILRGFVTGIAVVSSIYLLIPAVYLTWQYSLISADGTAYWGLLAMPAYWLWLPATSIGGVAGIAVAAVHARYRGVPRRGDSLDA